MPCALSLLAPAIVWTAWPQILPFVQDACEASHGRYAPEHIRRWAETAEWQIWLVMDADEILSVTGTQNVDYPTGLRTIAIRFCVGEQRERWQHYLEDILQWGRDDGCTQSEGAFRNGWRRVLKGWNHTHEFLERPL